MFLNNLSFATLHYDFYASLPFHKESSTPENFSSPYLFSGSALEKLS